MLPLYLLNAVKGEPVIVELKSGGLVNGILENCDYYMNVTLTSACASLQEDSEFHKVDHIYIKGTHIKLFKMGNEFIEKFKLHQQKEKDGSRHGNNRQNNYNHNNNHNNRPNSRQYNNHYNNNNNNNQRRNNRNNNNSRNGNGNGTGAGNREELRF